MKKWFMIGLSLCLSLQILGQASAAEKLALTLSDAEQKGLARSERVKVAEKEGEAAQARESVQQAALLPRLTLDGSWRYAREVASIALPTGQRMALGDNTSYSIGPMLSWTAFDGGGLWDSSTSAKKIRESKEQDLEAVRKQVLLAVRLAYFRVTLALEQMRMVADSLKLAQAQDRDIRTRLKAGASSRIDALSSHREVLSLLNQFRGMQSELSRALQDLLAFTEGEVRYDFSSPLAFSLADRLPEGVAPPSLLVEAESLESLLPRFVEEGGFSSAHPLVRALGLQADSLVLASEAMRAGLYPKVLFAAKASYDYPNGPVLERIQQNTVAATLSWPIFEFSRTRSEAAEKRAQAEAVEQRKIQMETELKRDFQKSRDQLGALVDQRKILQQSVEEATELARLVYNAYQAGRSSFLEVQSANLKSLEARVQLARNQVQILMQKAQLANLSVQPVQADEEKK